MLKSAIEDIEDVEEGKPIRKKRYYLLQTEITSQDPESFPDLVSFEEYAKTLVENESDLNADNKWVVSKMLVVDYPPSDETITDSSSRIKLLLDMGRDWLNALVDFTGYHGLTGVVGHKIMEVTKAIEFLSGVHHLIEHQTTGAIEMIKRARESFMEHAENCPECKSRMMDEGIFEKKEENPGPN